MPEFTEFSFSSQKSFAFKNVQKYLHVDRMTIPAHISKFNSSILLVGDLTYWFKDGFSLNTGPILRIARVCDNYWHPQSEVIPNAKLENWRGWRKNYVRYLEYVANILAGEVEKMFRWLG